MFKKKQPIVKDTNKEKPSAKKPLKEPSQNKGKGEAGKKSSKGLTSWVYQPALIVLLGFVIAYVLTDFFTLQESEQGYQKGISEQYLSSAKRSFEDYIVARKKGLSRLALNPDLEERSENFQTRLAPVLKDIWPEMQQFYHVSQQKMLDTRHYYPELSFASADLIRRSVQKKKVLVETFFQEKKWYLQIAAPLVSQSAEKQVEPQLLGDVVLAVFDFSALRSQLQRIDAASMGQIAVLGGQNKQVIALGSGDEGLSVSSATSIPGMTIRYAPDSVRLISIDRMPILIITLVCALLSIVLMVITLRANMTRVKKDILQVAQTLAKVLKGERAGKSFTFGEFVSMTDAVSEQIKSLVASEKEARSTKANLEKAKPETSASSPQTSDVDDAPLFDDDLLDLDVLSDADSLEADEGMGMVSEVKHLDIDVPQSIFRAYDIRGIVGETLNDGIVELIGKAIASEALAQGQSSICIAYDGRLSSEAYCEALSRGIMSTGLDATVIGRVPTPVLYFATHHFENACGVMVTGSHNPANYNGFKIVIDGKAIYGDEVQKLYNRILLQDFAHGQGARTDRDITREYLDTILNDIAVAAPLKVVLDAGNGVTGEIAPELIEELGCEVIPLHCEIDGNFPNHHPDPGKPENLQSLIAAVQENNADIGLAFDGDGDRIGVVTNTGRIIWPDRLLMLFAKDVVSRNPGADILFDVKCSRRLNSLVSSYGGRPVMWKSGHSLMKAKMRESGALLGGELSGHIFFKERWYGFDDGLYSAARLLEVLGIDDRSSEEVFADFPEDVSTPEITIDVSEESKFTIVESLCALKDQFVGGNASTIDGLRIDYPNGWGLCRASNTMPALVLRFEADTEDGLAQIKSLFKAQLQVVDPSLDCSF